MIKIRKDIHVPVICCPKENGAVDVIVPDLHITISGKDYVEAIANAIFYVSSIYYFNLERDYLLPFSATYSEVEDSLGKYPKGSFATLINIADN